MGDPVEKSRRGPSDRVPLAASMARRPPLAAGNQPIPAWVCKSPLFGSLLEELEIHVQVAQKTGVKR